MITSLTILGYVTSVLIFAATNTPAPPPDLTGLAAIITAAIGVFGFLATIYRGRQNNKRVGEVEDAASYVKGFDALAKHLREELEDMKQSQIGEREEFKRRVIELEEDMGKLKVEINQKVAEIYTVKGDLAELNGRIKGYLTPEQYKEFVATL